MAVIPNNLLLAGLAASSLTALMSDSELVTLSAGQRLHGRGERVEYAYFPIDAAISLATSADTQSTLDIGVVGYEGMIGVGLILDSPVTEFTARVQTSGRAWRVNAALFIRQLEERPSLRTRMNRYAHVRLLQLAQDIGCRNFHLLEGRLARHLLMARDRARCSKIVLTHEMLAGMLGVRRAGITLKASALQKRGMLHYSRGHIEVIDLAALRATACPCYVADRSIYARLLGLVPE